VDKKYLRGQLQTIKNNFAFVQLSVALIAQPNALEIFDDTLDTVKNHPETDSFSYIRYVFGSEELLKQSTNQFRQSVLRNCLKEAFELMKLYGEEHGQAEVIRGAPWYGFLRITRNCLSHDMRLRFNKYDLKQLPVSWSGLTIDASMQNQPLPMHGFLTRQKAVELIDDVIRYVEQYVD